MNLLKRTRPFVIIFIVCLFSSFQSSAQVPGKIKQTKQILLPNGWKLSPAGNSLTLGDLPLNMQLSKSKKLLAVTNNGQSTQSVQLIDSKREKILDEKIVGKSWYGLAFSNDEKHLYASGGNDNVILDFQLEDNKLGIPDTICLGLAWPKEKICPAGIAVTKDNKLLYAVTKEDNSIYVVNLDSKNVIAKVSLPTIAYSCVLSPDEKILYVSLWGEDRVAIFNTELNSITTEIKTGSHPNELLLNKKGDLLFVANANGNTVSVINTTSNKVVVTLSAALFPTSLTDSTTNGLALSADEKTLYIANADNNCLAIFDVGETGNYKSIGFIPVGWYPTNVKSLGNKILVTKGKGFISVANPNGPQPISKNDDSEYQMGISAKNKLQYIAGLFKGTLSFIDAPAANKLKKYTQQVYANTPFNEEKITEADGEANNPIPRKKGAGSSIKHVSYIIKENRTYDQVMGDVKTGNGEDSLCIFGERITPNHHAIANDFILLDNFYVDAEVSADGHDWSTAAYSTDMVEKSWPTVYCKRGGSNGWAGRQKAFYPRDGFIWDYCQRGGISYRSYGEFCEYGKTTLKALEGHVCPQFPGFDLDIKDQIRVDAWEHDFDSLVVINAVP